MYLKLCTAQEREAFDTKHEHVSECLYVMRPRKKNYKKYTNLEHFRLSRLERYSL